MTKTFPEVSPISLETVTLERIQLYNVELVDEYLAERIKKNLKVAEYEDGYEFRRAFCGFGKAERQTMRCPSTWWQHLKLAVRQRWPRLFGRLNVRFDERTIEGGALVTGLRDKIEDRKAARLVIPVTMPSFTRTYIDDPTSTEEA